MPYKDKEKQKEAVRKSYHNNLEKERERSRIKYHKNKEEYSKRSKEYREKNMEKFNLKAKNYRDKYPEKIKAHSIANQIPLKNSCEICDSTEKLERHHWRYDQPEKFVTLCNECHIAQHYPVPMPFGG
jgi:hypothetical protein